MGPQPMSTLSRKKTKKKTFRLPPRERIPDVSQTQTLFAGDLTRSLGLYRTEPAPTSDEAFASGEDEL